MKFMKRKILYLAFLLSCGMLSGLEVIHIAPFYHIDETKDEVRPSNNHHKKLIEKLQSVETGLQLIFTLTQEERGQNPPQSLAEAIRVARNEQANYLLYGYFAEKDYTMYAEVKLLDYESRSLARIFYSVDDLDNHDRLLSDLSTKILAFVEETYNIKILEHEMEHSEWRMYGELGYWTPMGSDWTRLMIGTGAAAAGIRFIPNDRLAIKRGFLLSLSAGLELSYKFGLGNPDLYAAYDHTLTIGLPFRLHAKLNPQHSISAGIGLLYTFDFLSFKDPHDDREMKIFRGLGNSLMAGYGFRMKENISVTADNRFEFHYYDRILATYSLRIGIEYLLSRKEAVRKW